jgi:hypothetical protein
MSITVTVRGHKRMVSCYLDGGIASLDDASGLVLVGLKELGNTCYVLQAADIGWRTVFVAAHVDGMCDGG